MEIKSVAIVTGASQGIGRAMTLRLARDFSAVTLAARDKENLQTAASEVTTLGTEAMTFAIDLRLPQSAPAVVKGTLEHFGRIDAFLNIAAAVPQIDSNGIAVNQKAAFLCALPPAKNPCGEEEAMERRIFIGALTAASIGVVFESSLAQIARAENNAPSNAQPTPRIPFETSQVQVSGNTIYVRRYGTGPAILMVHGFPRTSLMWRFLAPKLAENHTVICVDLRAYGQSGIPASTDHHFPYSKRAMAAELVGVMDKLGFPTFTLIGHDRGGRVSYRMALDHPKAVERLAVFDVIPILEAWNRSDARFARTYWPWILLSQQPPLPESYLLGAPEAVFHNPFGQGSFGQEVLDEYVMTYRDPARVHGICEEYRAAATIDVEHDRADREAGKRIDCPMLHLWAEGGPLDTFYGKDGGPLGIWRQWAPDAHGQAMKGGHFFPEENPDDTAVLVRQFLST